MKNMSLLLLLAVGFSANAMENKGVVLDKSKKEIKILELIKTLEKKYSISIGYNFDTDEFNAHHTQDYPEGHSITSVETHLSAGPSFFDTTECTYTRSGGEILRKARNSLVLNKLKEAFNQFNGAKY